MQPALKQYKLAKNGRLFFWTFLFQIAVASAVTFLMALSVITGWAHHMGTAFARAPWLWYSILVGSFLFLIASGIAIINYRKKKASWVDWAIGIGCVLTILFVVETVLDITRGSLFADFAFRYDIFMFNINLAFVAFLIKYKTNAQIAEDKAAKGEQLILEETKDPKIAKILFSIAAYALCIEIGFTCAIAIPAKTMAIIGSVIVGLIAFIIVAIVFGNISDEKEYIEY